MRSSLAAQGPCRTRRFWGERCGQHQRIPQRYASTYREGVTVSRWSGAPAEKKTQMPKATVLRQEWADQPRRASLARRPVATGDANSQPAKRAFFEPVRPSELPFLARLLPVQRTPEPNRRSRTEFGLTHRGRTRRSGRGELLRMSARFGRLRKLGCGADGDRDVEGHVVVQPHRHRMIAGRADVVGQVDLATFQFDAEL